jgi:hypothetical protein
MILPRDLIREEGYPGQKELRDLGQELKTTWNTSKRETICEQTMIENW